MQTGLGATYANSPTSAAPAPPPATGAGFAASQIASPTYERSIAGYLYGGYGAGIATAQLKGAVASGALGLSPAQLALNEQNLISTTGFTFASAMLGYQGLGLQSQTLARQASIAGQTQGVEQAAYGVAQTQYPQQAQEAAQKYAMTQFGLQSQAAGAGTLGTQGSRLAQQTAAQQYSWQLATIYRNQQLAQLSQQQEQLGFQTKAGGYANAQQQLALSAKQQGLSAQELQERLAFGLSQLGINATPANLLASAAQAQTGEATQIKAYLSQAGLLGGVSANVLGGQR